MKKFVAFLLCLIMLISLVSCGETKNNTDLTSNTENQNKDIQDSDYSNEKTPTSLEIYKPVLEVYRLAVDELKDLYSFVNVNPQGIASELFGLESSTKKEWFLSVINSIFFFYGGHGEENSISPHHKLSCGYAIKDLNGDGVDELVLLTDDYMVCAIFSITDGKPILLGNYRTRHSAWIDEKGWIHENGSSGADNSMNAVYKIADGGASMELIAEFGTNGHEWIGDTAYTKYYKLVNGEKVSITESEYFALNEQYTKYLGTHTGAEATKNYSSLTFISLYTEAEIAMQMYEAFLKNEIPSESGYLKNHREDYLMDYLWERNGSVYYAYVDMDGDGQVELLVSGIDTFVFTYYHDSNVISIATTYNFREMNRVYVDGSYSWNYPGSDGVSYGVKKDGKDIWRIENEGGSYTLYYIGEESVTQEEMLKYIEENPSPEEVTFSSISGEGWNKVIDKERAEEIASAYWGINDGDINEQTGKEYRVYVSGVVGEKYYVRLHSGYYYESDIDVIYIDAITGNILADLLPDGKG